MFNSQLADQVLGVIEANPERHNQRLYATRTGCGTAYCFAGWACVLADGLTEDAVRWHPGATGQCEYGNIYRNADEWVDIHNRARELLGLDFQQAYDLFEAHNTVDDLKRIVKDFANNASVSE